MGIQPPTSYTPVDRLKIWLNGIQQGATLVARRLNFSSKFIITEDTANNFYDIDVTVPTPVLPTDLAKVDQSNTWTASQNLPSGSQVNSDNITTNTAAQTLTNKTLSGDTATNLVNGSGTFDFNSSGTITSPNATDTLVGKSTTDTLTNKTINATNNTVTDTSTATGDLLKSNGTKFLRFGIGTSLQVLRTNSGATDLEFASLNNERVGKSQASGNGSTTVFNIAHGLGSNPSYAFPVCSSLTTAFTYTTDSTNIVITFSTAPPSGTNNVVVYWQVIA